MVVAVRRGPRRAPIVRGMVVGGAIANSRNRQRQQAAATQAQINQANNAAIASAAQADSARAEAEAAKAQADVVRAEAEAAKAQANAAAVPQPVAVAGQSGLMTMHVIVPKGVGPGMHFNVNANGNTMTVTCPAGVSAGQTLAVQVPVPQQSISVAAAPAYAHVQPATMLSVSNSGKDLFREALMDPASAPMAVPPSAMGTSTPGLVLIADHVVDESSLAAFNIISVIAGTTVNLVEGTLENGLGGAYKDYLKVSVPTQGGRVGLISRMVVKPATAVGPPPAIGF